MRQVSNGTMTAIDAKNFKMGCKHDPNSLTDNPAKNVCCDSYGPESDQRVLVVNKPEIGAPTAFKQICISIRKV